MDNIETYKGLSNRIYIFGFLPSDFGIMMLFTLMLWGVSNSFTISIITFVCLFIFFKKMKRRPDGYFKSIIMFLNIPYFIGIDSKDIPSYKEVMNKDE